MFFRDDVSIGESRADETMYCFLSVYLVTCVFNSITMLFMKLGALGAIHGVFVIGLGTWTSFLLLCL